MVTAAVPSMCPTLNSSPEPSPDSTTNSSVDHSVTAMSGMSFSFTRPSPLSSLTLPTAGMTITPSLEVE